MFRRFLPLAGICLLLAFSPVHAQEAQEDLEPGWHIVRLGETLEGLAVRYLGSSQLWKQLAQLNPDVADPNRIEPGQRIRVMIPRRASLPVAQVERVSRKVEEQPQPNPWVEARPGDLLAERDAVRTYPRSSAVMKFRDGTNLVITEDSLVFLHRAGGRLQGVPAHSVEIVEGQADVEVRPGPAASGTGPEVEIVLGPTRTRSRPSPAGQSQARARKAEGGAAKVMVYGGEGEVEAGGVKVQVAQGMGTSVESQGPPSPPEKLLPAPRPTAPAPGAEPPCANPLLSWEPQPEAESYVVEVCRDPECRELAERATGVAAPPWRSPVLPAGDFHWRVTARSRSGLDGYPGETSRMTIRPDGLDQAPPTGSIQVSGPSVRIGEKVYFGPAARLEVVAADDASGLEGWTPAVDGREADPKILAGPWSNGEHRVEAAALDLCGNRGPIEAVSFTVDAEPPAIRWEVAEAARGERGKGRRFGRSPRPRREDLEAPGLTWPRTLPEGFLRWNPAWAMTGAIEAVHETVEVVSDLPEAFLRIEGVRLVTKDGTVPPVRDGQVLQLRAEDGAARVERMVLRTRTTEEGPVLEVEAVDGVGNVGKVEWRLERAPGQSR
ncbi:MAG TPA: LysM peptidoglycan-binding domain-containing protein [Thermoanaerobaculia bacterium]|nr:LysM peptidoglycan-binding domain-containing protein [Thermoanaerobaculia bacterium]